MATSVVNRGTRAGKQQQQQSSPAAAMAGSHSSPAALEVEEITPLNSSSKLESSSVIISSISSFSRPLELESHTAFQALLVAPLVVWWVAILLGMWFYEGRPHGQTVYHVMLWFDNGVLRPAGALVPFAVLAARAGVHWFAHQLQNGGFSNSSSSSLLGRGAAAGVQQRRQQGMRLGSLVLSCFVVYSSVALARLAIYLTHSFLLKNRLLEFHIVSDHIFLAATMLASLHAELCCLLSDMLRAIRSSSSGSDSSSDSSSDAVSWREAALTLLFVVTLFLYLFTVADMYYTTKYFHFPLESFSTTVLVFIMFQLPVVLWLTRQRSLS